MFTVHANSAIQPVLVPQLQMMITIYYLSCSRAVCVRKNVSFSPSSHQIFPRFAISLLIYHVIGIVAKITYNFSLFAVHTHCIKDKTVEDFEDDNPSFCGKDCLKVLLSINYKFTIVSSLECHKLLC